MARLARIDGSHTPTIERLTLPEALQRVIEGRMSGQTFYGAAPKAVCEWLDGASQEVARSSFTALTSKDQGEVCRAILAAMNNVPGS
jgi:hypothetical protein